jgi:hypothetical protein
LAALGAQLGLLALQLQRQCILQPACAAASVRRASSSWARCSSCQAAGLLRGGVNGALPARRGAPARLRSELPPPAPGAPGCAAARGRSLRLAFGLDHRSSSWAWRSWLSASCMSSSSKRASAVTRRSLQVVQLGLDFGQVGGDLLAARARLLGQLRQAQRLHLQLVGARLGLGGLAARGRNQALGGVGIGGFGAHQRGAGLVADQGLRAQLLVEVLDLLRARQQAGLLGVGRIKTHAVRVTAWPLRTKMTSPGCSRSRSASASSRLGGGVAALQPVRQQRLLSRRRCRRSRSDRRGRAAGGSGVHAPVAAL